MLAQTEFFEGIKFKCAICGMRFVRNQTLKDLAAVDLLRVTS